MIRYFPGWVLNGNVLVDVEVLDDIADEEDIEAMEDDDVGFGCVGVFLSLCDAEIPPPTPPPTAAPSTTSATTNTIQNIRVESPHMRGAEAVDAL
jgi:hypothetical protein